MKTTGTVAPFAAGPIPSLDGLRAIAVTLVFMAHSGLEKLIPGGLGVTIFFVLSGYLITTLMRIEHQRSGRIDFSGFYLRRFLRLMPPLFIVIMLVALLSALDMINGNFSSSGLLAALFYLGNYHIIFNDFHGMPAGMGVVWSLAIEEHYYLFFPPLALLLLRKNQPVWSISLLGLLCASVLAWRYVLAWQGASADYLMMATDTRVDAILVGSLMALVRNPWFAPLPTSQRTSKPILTDWATAGLCLGILLLTVLYRNDVFRHTLRYSLQSLAIAGLIHLAVSHADQLPFRWLSARPLVYIGSISYTIYLTHHVILLGLAKHWPQLGWAGLTLLGAVLTLAVAEPMRRWVDQPCARWRQKLHRKPPAGTSPTVLMAVPGS
jgi:peptidoglycan/LPS O-acetylase OafA/YrhL